MSPNPRLRLGRRSRSEDGVTAAERILGDEDASLLDIVDNTLSKGVVLSGDLTIGLAQVDLVYARLSLLLCAADRVLPGEDAEFMERHHHRHELREGLHDSTASAPMPARASKRRTRSRRA